MRGYEVVTSDDRVVGRVADVRDGYLIVESGRLRKTLRPVPREFVHAVDEAAKAFVTVPRRVLMDAPELDRHGNFDRRAAARHFGLAESYIQAPTEGRGDTLGHDPAWGPDRDAAASPEHRRAEIRKHLRPGYADQHRPTSPALLGDRHIDQRRVKRED
jgi:hypothetical protein